ncbi:acyl-CoA thioester hydrolase [Loktanella sp. DSM 29012]|uniref:tol-pal system-associated acyl-CoA thioesterase n=1 Tax=Loktanella sp. DSM 29012 TaxID=1881056 RepID=UPI0008B9A299|nr:tol-pal system-associated acyl-CoA thioesterase [Loktanella sp. DSM 29012]SEP82260.1 acyl-CoA thioester hydrolase [Loktanella sp. DSM 29012]
MTHQLPVRVYYEDTDMGGIVYYANYLKYIERARSEMVEDLGMNQIAMRDAGIVFVVTRVVADYVSPARLDDRLTVVTTHHAQSPVRWVFDQEVRRGDDLLFRAEVTAVCMTLDGKPTRLPKALRGQVSAKR